MLRFKLFLVGEHADGLVMLLGVEEVLESGLWRLAPGEGVIRPVSDPRVEHAFKDVVVRGAGAAASTVRFDEEESGEDVGLNCASGGVIHR